MASNDWSNVPGKDWATLTRGTERKIYVPGVGWQFPSTINKERTRRGLPPIKDPGQPQKPKSAPTPSQTSSTENPKPQPLPVIPYSPTPTPTPKPQESEKPSTEKPKPKPQESEKPPTETSKPQVSQTGDRTKDLTTWALANKKMIDKVGTKSQREILKSAQSGTPMPAPRPLITKEEKMDAFDLVLEYLTSEGHVDTLDEALYVMMEMDAETIQGICQSFFTEELTGARKERAQEIMGELRPHGRPRKATNKKYGALSRVTRASEGSSEPGRTTETSPKKRGGRMPKGSVKTGWDGDFQADRPKG